MYRFLPDSHNKVLNQIDPQTGMLELDMSDEDHCDYFLSQVGGLAAFEQKHPHLVSSFHELRTTPLNRTLKLSKEGYKEGPEDKIAIENLIFHGPAALQAGLVGDEPHAGKTMAVIMADYIQPKAQISVVTQLYDVTNEILLHTETGDIEHSSKYKGSIQADYPHFYQDKPREFMITSTFYSSNSPVNGLLSGGLKAHVTKSAGFTLDGNTNIIKSFTLNDPVIKASHTSDPNHKEVKISYTREGAIPDYDYTSDLEKFLNGDDKKILVRVPFSVTVEAADKWWINGFDEEYGYRMWLKNMVNGTINHYGNYESIIQRKDAFDDHNRCKKMTFIFPESWNNILDFTAVGYKAFTSVDFYSSFGVAMECDSYPVTVAVSVNSDADIYNNLNIKSAKIFIQWGCVARDTEIMMADGTLKRADQIMIGEFVRNAQGGIDEIKKVLTGNEAKLYKISTSNRSIRMTPDHKVSTEHGLLPAIDVQMGMRIQTVSGLEPVTAVEWTSYQDKVYNFEFAHETVIIGNGIFIGDLMLQNRDVKELTAHEA